MQSCISLSPPLGPSARTRRSFVEQHSVEAIRTKVNFQGAVAMFLGAYFFAVLLRVAWPVWWPWGLKHQFYATSSRASRLMSSPIAPSRRQDHPALAQQVSVTPRPSIEHLEGMRARAETFHGVPDLPSGQAANNTPKRTSCSQLTISKYSVGAVTGLEGLINQVKKNHKWFTELPLRHRLCCEEGAGLLRLPGSPAWAPLAKHFATRLQPYRRTCCWPRITSPRGGRRARFRCELHCPGDCPSSWLPNRRLSGDHRVIIPGPLGRSRMTCDS